MRKKYFWYGLILLMIMSLLAIAGFWYRLYRWYDQHAYTERRIVFTAQESETSKKLISRTGMLLLRPKARGVVFIMHGFMCEQRDIRFLRFLFPDFHVLTFDFRAHGADSLGQSCTFGLNEAYDVIGAVNAVKALPEMKNLPRIAYGFSMGAVATIMAQAKDKTLFEMMILDCPFESSCKVIERGIDKLKISLFGHDIAFPGKNVLKRHAYHPYVQGMLKWWLKTIAKLDTTAIDTCIIPFSPAQEIKKITIPVFIIGCKLDDKAPVDAVRAVYKAAGGYKRLWLTNGRCHFDSLFYNPEGYISNVQHFIDSVLSGAIKRKPQHEIIEDPEENAVASNKSLKGDI
jgi:pimeloyl-ACP methyl ester carboxylesterase